MIHRCASPDLHLGHRVAVFAEQLSLGLLHEGEALLVEGLALVNQSTLLLLVCIVRGSVDTSRHA